MKTHFPDGMMWAAMGIDRTRRMTIGLPVFVALAHLGCDRNKPTKVAIDTKRRAQTMEGMGTSLNGWDDKWTAIYQKPDFVDFYLRDLGASVVRVALGDGVVPETKKWEDILAADFQFKGRGRRAKNLIDATRTFHRASSGELRVIGSVWSPPGWMKFNGSAKNGSENRKNFALSLDDLRQSLPESRARAKTGNPFLHANRLRHDRYQHFAKSLVEWVRFYESLGIDLFGMSPQNEPRFSHWFGSAVYSGAELAKVVVATARMFQSLGQRMPRLYAPETMTHDTEGNRIYLEALAAGERPMGRLHALATHGYVDGYERDEDPQSPTRFLRLAEKYKKTIWMTEGGTGPHQWPAPLHHLAPSIMNSLVAGHASLVASWQVAGDEADGECLMPLAGPTKKTHVAKHFFRFIRPGMVRLLTEDLDDPMTSLACFAGDGKIVAIVLNRSDDELNIQFAFGQTPAEHREHYLTDAQHNLHELPRRPKNDFSLPPESLSTLVFRT